jgi:PKD repeat protein
MVILFVLTVAAGVVVALLPARETAAADHPDHVDLTEKGLLLDRQGFYPWADTEIGPVSSTAGPKPRMDGCGCLLAALSTVINYLIPGADPWFAVTITHADGTTFRFDRGVSPPYINEFLRNGDKTGPVTANWGYPNKAKGMSGCGIPMPRLTALERIVQPSRVTDGNGGVVEVGNTGIIFGTRDKFDTQARILALQWLKQNKPVIVGFPYRDEDGDLTGMYHTNIIVGFDPDQGKFLVVDPLWSLFEGQSEVPGQIAAAGVDAYNQWEDDISTVIFPAPVNTRNRYFEIRDDPAPIDLMTIDPSGRRAGVDGTNGVEYRDDPSLASVVHGSWFDITGAQPPGRVSRDWYIRNPRPGPYRVQVVARQATALRLALVDTLPGDRTAGTVLLGVDETMTAGEVRKYEIGYRGGGPASAVRVASFSPIADAGNDANGLTGTPIAFSGEASYDPDGALAAHTWEFGDGSTGTGARTAHTYQEPGDYTATLTITDDAGRTATDIRVVRVGLSQQRPVAMVSGPIIATATKGAFLFSGGSFDRNDDPLTYKWDFGDSAGAVTNTASGLSHPYREPGAYDVTLVVNDGHEDSLPAATTIKVVADEAEAVTVPGCVNPGAAITVALDNHREYESWDIGYNGPVPPHPTVTQAQAQIDLTGSFGGEYGRAEGFGEPPTVSAVHANSELQHSLTMTWTVPAQYTPGQHTVGFVREAGQLVRTVVSPCPAPANLPPRAHAGGPRYTVANGQPLLLDGSRSSDPDGDTLSYAWDLGDGHTATGMRPAHTFPAPGRYVVIVRVNDGHRGSTMTKEAVATVTVTDSAVDTPPEVSAGHDYSGREGSAVQLTGTAAEAGNRPLTLAWTYSAKPDVDPGASCTFSDAGSTRTTFTCNDDGVYQVTLTANDGRTATASSATVVVGNAPPTIDHLVASVPAGRTVTVAGRFADPGAHDTHVAKWQWGDGRTTSARPAAGGLTATHRYRKPGFYLVCVTVTDDDAGKDKACVRRRVAGSASCRTHKHRASSSAIAGRSVDGKRR